MDGLIMKYFVLKPSGDDPYAVASCKAMKKYAQSIEMENGKLSEELRGWVGKEEVSRMDRRFNNPPKSESGNSQNVNQQLKAEIAEVWNDLSGLAVKNDIDQAIIVDAVERLKQLSAV